MTLSVTPRADDLLTYLSAYMAEHGGLAPTYEQMRRHLGASSKSTVFRLIRQLEDRGRVRRIPNAERSIAVIAPTVRLPADVMARARASAARSGQSVEAVLAEAVRRHCAPVEAA